MHIYRIIITLALCINFITAEEIRLETVDTHAFTKPEPYHHAFSLLQEESQRLESKHKVEHLTNNSVPQDTNQHYLRHNDISLSESTTKATHIDTNDHLQKLTTTLQSLPEKSRPADIKQALDLIQQGQRAWDHIQEGNVYNAIITNIPDDQAKNISKSDYLIMKNAYNTNDATFWSIIKNDTNIQKKCTTLNIPFSLQSLTSLEQNMSLRALYADTNLANKDFLQSFKRAYQTAIVQVQWHLFAHAIIQDQAFTSGMITTKDPGHHLFKFLDGYAELVSPQYKLYNGTSLHSLLETKAYTRHSSHWKGQVNGNQLGIDIQDESNKPLVILPGNKSHLLFGTLKNNMVFLKWENYGTTLNPLEGDYSVIPHLKGYFEKHGKQDESTLHRREKIAPDITLVFNKLCSKPLTDAQIKYINTYGISGMIEMLKAYYPANLRTFENYLTQTKGYDPSTLSMRKGGEIILDHDKMSKSDQKTEFSIDDL